MCYTLITVRETPEERKGKRMSAIEKMVGELGGVKVVGTAVIISKRLQNAESLQKELMARLPLGIWVLVV